MLIVAEARRHGTVRNPPSGKSMASWAGLGPHALHIWLLKHRALLTHLRCISLCRLQPAFEKPSLVAATPEPVPPRGSGVHPLVLEILHFKYITVKRRDGTVGVSTQHIVVRWAKRGVNGAVRSHERESQKRQGGEESHQKKPLVHECVKNEKKERDSVL